MINKIYGRVEYEVEYKGILYIYECIYDNNIDIYEEYIYYEDDCEKTVPDNEIEEILNYMHENDIR